MIAEQERLEVVQEQARDVERLIEILRTREGEGEGSRFDRLRAEQEVRDVRQLVTSARVAVAAARSALAAMLPPDATMTRVLGSLYVPRTPIPIELLITRAPALRAELRALQHSAERTSLESEAARRARFPVPTVFGGLKRAGEEAGREAGTVFGVNLSLPIFDGGAREAARWTAERARIDAEHAALEQQIRTEIERASDALTLRQAAVSQDTEGDSNELMRIAEIAYREGEVGILELLDAVRTASRARLRSVDLNLDARLAQIAVERAVGDTLWP
jgi:cobalt-zinc-cadmium efflux system outer membrane protein